MLPELDVFHAHCDQLVHPEGVALHHKDLVFVPPAGQRVQQQVQYPAAAGWLVDSWVREVSIFANGPQLRMCLVVQTGDTHLALASRSPFLQSQMTMEWNSSMPTETKLFPSAESDRRSDRQTELKSSLWTWWTGVWVVFGKLMPN